MVRLSVNVNKVAIVRNARRGEVPRILDAARPCLDAGAGGITVHPRPDERHIRPRDVRELRALLERYPEAEFNVEGNPTPAFLDLVLEVLPHQCTLVPDPPDALTSSFGWDLDLGGAELNPVVRDLHQAGIRVSLFMETDSAQIKRAAETGADRIELYTEPYARAYCSAHADSILQDYVAAAITAQRLGMGVNAGHDLNLENLGAFCRVVPGLLEVSIGHALISRALEVGLERVVREYLDLLQSSNTAMEV
jgi:pyridoxine 5-phosphate synthase